MSFCTEHLKKRIYFTVDFFYSFFWGDGGMDGWVIYDFTSFSPVFQLYQDDDMIIMKGCVQWNPIYSRGDSRLEWGSNPGLLDQ